MAMSALFDSDIDKCQYRPRPNSRIAAAGIGLLLTLSSSCALAHGVQKLTNGLWYDGSGFVARTRYSVEGVLRSETDAKEVVTVDLGGGFVLPPFGNAHDHGLADAGFDAQNEEFLAKGIFYVANPNSIQRWTDAVREKALLPETVDVTYANGGLTSSGGWPVQIYDRMAESMDDFTAEELEGQAYYCIDDESELEEKWPTILKGSPDFIKVYLEHSENHEQTKDDPESYGKRGIDPRLLPKIVERAHEAGLRVAAHVTSTDDFRVALRSGVDELAHLPLEKLTREDADDAARRGTVIVTTTLSHRPAPGVDDLDAVHRGNLALLIGANARIVFGTDSGRTVLEEAETVAALTGMEVSDWLPILVETTPQWIFPDRSIGSLEDGFEASFLVVDQNPLQHPEALRDIAARFKNGHHIEVTPALPGIGQIVIQTIMHGGTDGAIAKYKKLRATEPDAYDFSEAQLNQAGYIMLQHDQVDAAIRLFELNVEMFPDAANVYDSLGEAYMKAGHTTRAIENYEQSLELNPHNTGAVEKLEALRGR